MDNLPVPRSACTQLLQASSEDPQQVQISSAYGARCAASELAAPSGTAEVAALLKRLAEEASQQGGAPVHVRATHKGWHSTASFPCATAGGGPQQARSVELLMSGMAAVLAADAAKRTISVQAGMVVSDLQAAAAAHGMAVPLMATPNYAGLTLSGVVATAATGSGAGGAVSTLCDVLLSITWVDGRGVVHRSDRHSDEGRAICGGLGLTGVVTELTLQLSPPGKVRVATTAHVPDAHLAADVRAMLASGASAQHLVVTWRPDMQQYTVHSFELYDGPAPVNASTNDVAFAQGQVQLFNGMLRDWQADVHSINPLLNGLVCGLAVPFLSLDHYWAVAAGSGAAIGITDANTIIATGCEAGGGGGGASMCNAFSQAEGLGVEDIHFVLDYPALDAWIDDVKAVIAADMPSPPTKHGLPLGGRSCLPPGCVGGAAAPWLLCTACAVPAGTTLSCACTKQVLLAAVWGADQRPGGAQHITVQAAGPCAAVAVQAQLSPARPADEAATHPNHPGAAHPVQVSGSHPVRSHARSSQQALL